MLKTKICSVACIYLAGCTGPAMTDPNVFALCERAHPSNRAELNYRTGRVTQEDMNHPVYRCSPRSKTCITSPILFASPGRELSGSDAEWVVDGFRFTATRVGESGRWIIEQEEETVRDEVLYDVEQGVLSLVTTDKRSGRQDEWVRCGGRLKFEDLAKLPAESLSWSDEGADPGD